MKKLVVLLLCMLLVVPAAFAMDVNFQGIVGQQITLGPDGAGTNVWGLSKSRLIMTGKANDDVSVFVMTKLDTASIDLDYAWIDVNAFGGMIRYGQMIISPSNWGGGIYQTNTFAMYTAVLGKGIGYASEIANVKYMIGNLGGLISDDEAKNYVLNMATKLADIPVGATVFVNSKEISGENEYGLAVEVEGSYTIDALTLKGQFFMDLNDNAAVIKGYGPTVAQQLVALYGSYAYGQGNVYVDYVLGLNDDTNFFGKESEIKGGVSYNLAQGVTLFGEAALTTLFGADDADGSTNFGIQTMF